MRLQDIVWSLMIGGIGAAVGYLATDSLVFTYHIYIGHSVAWIVHVKIAGAITAFIVCFMLSLWYLHKIREQDWNYAIFSGLIYGSMAGAISGFITGILVPLFEEIDVPIWEREDINILGLFFNGDFYSILAISTILGILIGAFLGFLISLGLGYIYFKLFKKA